MFCVSCYISFVWNCAFLFLAVFANACMCVPLSACDALSLDVWKDCMCFRPRHAEDLLHLWRRALSALTVVKLAFPERIRAAAECVGRPLCMTHDTMMHQKHQWFYPGNNATVMMDVSHLRVFIWQFCLMCSERSFIGSLFDWWSWQIKLASCSLKQPRRSELCGVGRSCSCVT